MGPMRFLCAKPLWDGLCVEILVQYDPIEAFSIIMIPTFISNHRAAAASTYNTAANDGQSYVYVGALRTQPFAFHTSRWFRKGGWVPAGQAECQECVTAIEPWGAS